MLKRKHHHPELSDIQKQQWLFLISSHGFERMDSASRFLLEGLSHNWSQTVTGAGKQSESLPRFHKASDAGSRLVLLQGLLAKMSIFGFYR